MTVGAEQQQQPLLEGVPVIDAGGFLNPDNPQQQAAQDVIDQVRDASMSWGFFQLVNHGVSQQLLDEHYEVMKKFFALPLDVKQGARRTQDNSMGYFNDEYTKQKMDLKEGFDFRHVQNSDLPPDHPENFDPQGNNRWPQEYPRFREVNERYMREMARVSFRLLEVFALGLGLQPRALDSIFQPSHTSFLRLNYYPIVPDAAPDSLGISPHKDAGFLTVLVQDSTPGLQVLRDHKWYTVQPIPGALTINVGDMAQVFTNDAFYASNHRVLKSSGIERYSRAFFFNPSFKADIAPSPGLTIAVDKAPHYRAINWGEFRRKRFEGDYANVGEEVQIDWYRQDRQQQ